MVQKSKTETAKAREARLAAELRANLQKRKAQARARRAGEADAREEGLAAAGPVEAAGRTSGDGDAGGGDKTR